MDLPGFSGQKTVNTPSLTWRRPTNDDLALLAELNKRLIADERSTNCMSVNQLEHRMKEWLSSGEYDALLFDQNGQSVAYVVYQQRNDSVFLRQFFVEQFVRRRGIGREAIRILTREVFPPGLRLTLDVLATNDRAQAFWNAVGFTPYSVMMETITG